MRFKDIKNYTPRREPYESIQEMLERLDWEELMKETERERRREAKAEGGIYEGRKAGRE